MNTNRNNNNRRRGRGNNRGQGGGGGPQSNRIDSRARGNAPQLLEKYRKLAHDASLNDDRVQTEYYLQFADHYFRVLADSRTQKDDGRPRRDEYRDQPFDEDDEEEEFEARREPPVRAPRKPGPAENAPAEGSQTDAGSAGGGSEREREAGGDDANPFVRDGRKRRPRTRARTKGGENGREESGREEAGERVTGSDQTGAGDPRSGVDPGVLPPAISRKGADDSDKPGAENQGEDAPERARAAPRPRTRRARPAADSGDAEALEAVN